MSSDQLLDLSITKPDFESYAAKLEGNLINRGSWTDIYPEATGETLIHYNSAIGTVDQWAIEKAFKENFITTATNDSSIYACARMLGIRISRKIPGIQKCYLMRVNKINQPITGSLVVNEYSQFYVNDSIPFFNRILLNFVDTTNELNSVLLCQGLVLTKTFVSDGSPFIQIVLPALSPFSISDLDLKVTVNGEPWETIYDGLWRYGLTSKVVSDSTLGNGDVILQFGNGLNGMIPPSGSEIIITYVETLGSKQSLIANLSPVTSAITLNGFILEGAIVKDSSVNLIDINIGSCAVSLSSLTDSMIKASLPLGYSWSISTIGLQLDGNPGLGLVVGVSGREATLSVVAAFNTFILPIGTWTLSIPSTGYDEKPPAYYKTIAPSLRRAGSSAVTPQDHASIFLSYPGVSDVLVRTEKDLYYKQSIAKSPGTIANEVASGTYTGIDTYEIVNSPHSALLNVIWVSILTQTGTQLSSIEKTELAKWFDTKQFSGSIIRFQDPVPNYITLSADLWCSQQADPVYVKNKADVIIRDLFKTDKAILSKRITTSDISKALIKNLGSDLDSYSLYFVSDLGVRTVLTDDYLIPTDAGINSIGFPTPPGYLALYNLTLNSNTTSR
jgi:hypothetical protein